ncbi:hypothetical protein ACJJTC_010591 [Scirpophaga incertulas]
MIITVFKVGQAEHCNKACSAVAPNCPSRKCNRAVVMVSCARSRGGAGRVRRAELGRARAGRRRRRRRRRAGRRARGAAAGAAAAAAPLRGAPQLHGAYLVPHTLPLPLVLLRQPRRSVAHLSFTVPLVPLVPYVSVCMNVYLMVQLDYQTWVRFIIWLVIGYVIYFGYGLRNSSLNEKNLPVTDKKEMAASSEKIASKEQITTKF